MTSPWSVAACCIRGLDPLQGGRSTNEDNYLIAFRGQQRLLQDDQERVEAAQGSGLLAAVADGMGGHEQGAVASAAAVMAMGRLYQQGHPQDLELALHTHVLRAHQRLKARAEERGAPTMGTTLTAFWAIGGRLAWVHVGDSRLYLLRQGRLTQLSRDHTRGEFAERDGRSQPETGAGRLTQNFIFGSRGLGDNQAIRVDAGRDTGSVELAAGDRFLLTTDGVHAVLPQGELGRMLAARGDAEALATAVVQRALDAGSDDNLTALVFCVDALAVEAEAPQGQWSSPLSLG
jgi:protein phosphatase